MLLPLFERLESTGVGDAIRSSTWLFPVIEAFHLVGLAVIGGAILLVDFRLLGLGLKQQPLAALARELQPWIIGSLLVMFASGIPLFLSEAVKCYYSFAFWTKMTSLLLAIGFTFTVRRRVALTDEGTTTRRVRALVGLTSLALWSTVGWGGRWIGFS